MANVHQFPTAGAASGGGRGGDQGLAPWPALDKGQGQIVIGAGLSLSYISSIFRLSMLGYRQQYVDLLDELLEKEPHGFSVLQKRVLSVATGELQLRASIDGDAKAEEICKACTEMVNAIPDLSQHLGALAWATYYAVTGTETHWQRDGRTWFPERLSFIHSRRLSYPISGSWDLYLWDLGAMMGGALGGMPSLSTLGPRPNPAAKQSLFGLRIADAPGKFMIHAPQIRGNYPIREGLGRQLAYWFAMKLIGSRKAPAYLQRWAEPIPEASYSRGDKGSASTPGATEEDIADAKTAMKAMGAGQLASWVHADAVTLSMNGPDGTHPAITFAEWISICNAEISKAVLGGTLSTEVGHGGGNRSLGDTQKKSESLLINYDAKLLAATIKRDLITWLVRLNFPGVHDRYIPHVKIHCDDAPDPLRVIEKNSKAASAGMPVDADAVAREAGITLVKNGDLTARRMYPILGQKDPASLDEDLAARADAIAKKYPPPVETTDTKTAPATDENGEPIEAEPTDDTNANDAPGTEDDGETEPTDAETDAET